MPLQWTTITWENRLSEGCFDPCLINTGPRSIHLAVIIIITLNVIGILTIKKAIFVRANDGEILEMLAEMVRLSYQHRAFYCYVILSVWIFLLVAGNYYFNKHVFYIHFCIITIKFYRSIEQIERYQFDKARKTNFFFAA